MGQPAAAIDRFFSLKEHLTGTLNKHRKEYKNGRETNLCHVLLHR
jgi:hypothetical protein